MIRIKSERSSTFDHNEIAAQVLVLEQLRAFVQQVFGDILGLRFGAHPLQGKPADQHGQRHRQKRGEEDQDGRERQHLSPPAAGNERGHLASVAGFGSH